MQHIYTYIDSNMWAHWELHILLAKVKQKLSQLKTFYSKHFLAAVLLFFFFWVVLTLHISVCTSGILLLLTCHPVNWQNDWQEASFSEHSTFNPAHRAPPTAHSRPRTVDVVRLICHYLYGHLKSFEWNVRQSSGKMGKPVAVAGAQRIPHR